MKCVALKDSILNTGLRTSCVFFPSLFFEVVKNRIDFALSLLEIAFLVVKQS